MTSRDSEGQGEQANTPLPVSYKTPFPFLGESTEHEGHIYQMSRKHNFMRFKSFADSMDGFELQNSKMDQFVVWSKKLKGEPMHVIKVFGVFLFPTESEKEEELAALNREEEKKQKKELKKKEKEKKIEKGSGNAEKETNSTEETTPVLSSSFKGCYPNILYDMIHDSVFRGEWDSFRKEAFEIVRLNVNNDIGYYAGNSPLSLVASRDFVNQRMWFMNSSFYEKGEMLQAHQQEGESLSEEERQQHYEYIIFNTSVPHNRIPENYQKVTYNTSSSWVRGTSKITGYLIQPYYEDSEDEEEEEEGAKEKKGGADQTEKPEEKKKKKIIGTSLTYLTHSDPGGWIPTSITNYVATRYAPNTIHNIEKALVLFQRDWLPSLEKAYRERGDADIENPVHRSWFYSNEDAEYINGDWPPQKESNVGDTNPEAKDGGGEAEGSGETVEVPMNEDIETQTLTIDHVRKMWREERRKRDKKKGKK